MKRETVHEGRVKAFQSNLAEREQDLKKHLNISLGADITAPKSFHSLSLNNGFRNY